MQVRMKGDGAPALWCPTTAAAISSMLGTSALKVTSRLVLSTTRDMAVLASLPQGMRKGLVVARGVARGEKRAVGGKLQHPVVEAFAVALDWSRLCPRFFLKYRFNPCILKITRIHQGSSSPARAPHFALVHSRQEHLFEATTLGRKYSGPRWKNSNIAALLLLRHASRPISVSFLRPPPPSPRLRSGAARLGGASWRLGRQSTRRPLKCRPACRPHTPCQMPVGVWARAVELSA